MRALKLDTHESVLSFSVQRHDLSLQNALLPCVNLPSDAPMSLDDVGRKVRTGRWCKAAVIAL
jgi:hypothetical protein